MKANNTVKVDIEYIQKILKAKRIPERNFSKWLGYDESWFGYVKRSGGKVKRNVVTLMCRMFDMDEDKVILKEPEPIPEPVKQEDDNIRALLCTMVRIEQKLNILLEKM